MVKMRVTVLGTQSATIVQQLKDMALSVRGRVGRVTYVGADAVRKEEYASGGKIFVKVRKGFSFIVVFPSGDAEYRFSRSVDALARKRSNKYYYITETGLY